MIDFVKYYDSYANGSDICKELDKFLSENEELALLFSRAYRKSAAQGTPFVKLSDAIKHFKAEPHQVEAFNFLDTVVKYTPVLLPKPISKKLKEPIYFSQRDNYRDPHRTCNASATAMAVKYLKPNALAGDDEFVREVFKVGDPTIHAVVDKVAAKYGVKASFDTSMTYDDLKEDLKKGLPVVLSIKHRGPIALPTGGHMVLAYEWIDGVGLKVHDPYGNLYTDYTDTNGKALVYKFTDLNRRWLGAFTPNKGWGRRFHG